MELVIFRHPNKTMNYELKVKINGNLKRWREDGLVGGDAARGGWLRLVTNSLR